MKITHSISLLAASVLLTFATAASAQHNRFGTAPAAQSDNNPVLDGARLYQEGDYDGAVSAFQQEVQNQPNDTLAKVWLGLA